MIRRWGVPVLALLGVLVSGYLSYHRLAGGALACFGAGQACDVVNASRYAHLGGIPVAYIGLAGYLLLGALGVYTAAPRAYVEQGILVGWGASLGALLFSAYLTYIEVAVLHAICQWCVASATLTLMVFALYTWRLITGFRK